MQKIDLEKVISENYAGYWNKKSELAKKIILYSISKLIKLNEINEFLIKSEFKKNINFIDELFEYLNFSYFTSDKNFQKIPAEGRLLIVSNHPLGALDGLALLKAVSNVRPDVKIVGNDILKYVTNISELILPVEIEGGSVQRNNLKQIMASIEKEEAIIFFPAAEVSRLKFFNITDNKWRHGVIQLAKKFNAPVLPVFVKARNSYFFYIASAFHKYFSRFLLPREIFHKRNKNIEIEISDPIPGKAFANQYVSPATQIKLLKKHVYKIGRGKPGIFVAEKNIIHPIQKKLLKQEINRASFLGLTNDGYKIIITDFENSPHILKEIARLREITFRSVGEGTGNKMDLDKFDNYYKHLIVWDDHNLEIVGSYRIGLGIDIYEKFGIEGFYTASLFNYSPDFLTNYIPESIELGRSFVQKKYWNTNALNYLWQGIGAFIAHNPDIKFLFGAVSISNSYPEDAKKRIVYFYNKWFGSVNNLAHSNNRFHIKQEDAEVLSKEFNGKDYKEDFKILKKSLQYYGFSVPVLFKHYSDLCSEEGVKFLDFGVDEEFENCIDGLIVLSVDKIKEEKKERYINRFVFNNTNN